MDHSGAPFKKFASLRDEWALKNCYISPGILYIDTIISPFVSAAFTEALFLGFFNSGIQDWSKSTFMLNWSDWSYLHYDLSLLLTMMIFVVGPIQFSGPGSEVINHTLLLELEAQA